MCGSWCTGAGQARSSAPARAGHTAPELGMPRGSRSQCAAPGAGAGSLATRGKEPCWQGWASHAVANLSALLLVQGQAGLLRGGSIPGMAGRAVRWRIMVDLSAWLPVQGQYWGKQACI